MFHLRAPTKDKYDNSRASSNNVSNSKTRKKSSIWWTFFPVEEENALYMVGPLAAKCSIQP